MELPFSLYSLTWISIGSVLMCFAFLITYRRHHLINLLPSSFLQYFPSYAPIPTFDAAQSSGYTSSNFDLSANLSDEDRRQLDLEEVRRIMAEHRCNFDQARLIRHNRYLARNGVDPLTGLPTDRKAITSLA
ncbi:hypothetical protein DFH28DRAFT_1120033 [Melampsora americana]|nr:hypothetical protein DFH28DRAFT_1120033 [Melampsora americana]